MSVDEMHNGILGPRSTIIIVRISIEEIEIRKKRLQKQENKRLLSLFKSKLKYKRVPLMKNL